MPVYTFKIKFGFICPDGLGPKWEDLACDSLGNIQYKQWPTMGVSSDATTEQIKDAYRVAVKVHHPDSGGSHEAMVRLNGEYEEAMRGR